MVCVWCVWCMWCVLTQALHWGHIESTSTVVYQGKGTVKVVARSAADSAGSTGWGWTASSMCVCAVLLALPLEVSAHQSSHCHTSHTVDAAPCGSRAASVSQTFAAYTWSCSLW